MQITDTITETITDTIKKIELPSVELPSIDINEYGTKAADRAEQVSRTAVETYSDTSDRVLDIVVDTNKKVVDVVVTNVAKVHEVVEPKLADTPLAGRIPAPAELGKAYLDVVDRVTGFNRDLNKKVVDMVPAAKPAPKKAAAKKAPAKKTPAKKTAAA